MISHGLGLDELVRNMHIIVNHDECVKVVVTLLKKDQRPVLPSLRIFASF